MAPLRRFGWPAFRGRIWGLPGASAAASTEGVRGQIGTGEADTLSVLVSPFRLLMRLCPGVHMSRPAWGRHYRAGQPRRAVGLTCKRPSPPTSGWRCSPLNASAGWSLGNSPGKIWALFRTRNSRSGPSVLGCRADRWGGLLRFWLPDRAGRWGGPVAAAQGEGAFARGVRLILPTPLVVLLVSCFSGNGQRPRSCGGPGPAADTGPGVLAAAARPPSAGP